ncbi:unnamed protein product [Porites evermanni]|uniref:Reverse transcriptase domain-containing protein n=1 Tax=Porites evermanni TaxID=104178 RepID=A0ABN8R877_9CNID|nr:unnamed protein product [Porites evermanni]
MIHCYADDSQVYISFTPNDRAEQLSAVRNMKDCIRGIRFWMLNNDLKFNDDRTEFLIIGSSHVTKICCKGPLGNAVNRQILESLQRVFISLCFICHFGFTQESQEYREQKFQSFSGSKHGIIKQGGYRDQRQQVGEG